MSFVSFDIEDTDRPFSRTMKCDNCTRLATNDDNNNYVIAPRALLRRDVLDCSISISSDNSVFEIDPIYFVGIFEFLADISTQYSPKLMFFEYCSFCPPFLKSVLRRGRYCDTVQKYRSLRPPRTMGLVTGTKAITIKSHRLFNDATFAADSSGSTID